MKKRYALLVLVALLMASTTILAVVRIRGSPLVRDLAIYLYAKAHTHKVPYERSDIPYWQGEERQIYSVKTNSPLLAEWCRLVAPQYDYEGIDYLSNCAVRLVFQPISGWRSHHIAGFTNCWGYIVLNERYVLDPEWRDKRELFGTLVHELTHYQGGIFCGDRETVETYTELGAYEILGALCRQGNELACNTFWSKTVDFAGSSIWYESLKNGWEDKWIFFLKVFFWDKKKEWRSIKRRDFWRNKRGDDELIDILERYDVRTWREFVIPMALDTTIYIPNTTGEDEYTQWWGELRLTNTNWIWQHSLGMRAILWFFAPSM